MKITDITEMNDENNNPSRESGQYLWLDSVGHPRGGTDSPRTPATDLGIEYTVPSVGHTLHHLDMVSGIGVRSNCRTQCQSEERLTKPHDDLII